jgi:NAD(P)-dependent dehydrogenase (short-subunit alcohol dehydrogenase family)
VHGLLGAGQDAAVRGDDLADMDLSDVEQMVLEVPDAPAALREVRLSMPSVARNGTAAASWMPMQCSILMCPLTSSYSGGTGTSCRRLQRAHLLRGGHGNAGHGGSVPWRENPRMPEPTLSPVLDAFRLDGRVAIVTGASSGLGVAFARALAQAGADIALGARRTDRLNETKAMVAALGRRATAVATDVAKPGDCEALVRATVEQLGRVDILVNNAGVGTAVPALRETPEEFERVIGVNLNGAYWMAQAAARAMEAGGTIINISSVLGITTAGLPQAAYSASKAGLNGLTRDLAQQWTSRRGIRVNSIAPGFFASEMTDEYASGYIEAQLNRIPARRIGDERELAATVVFLAGPGAGYITGQTLPVDGGLTIA